MFDLDLPVRGLEPLAPLVAALIVYIVVISVLWLLFRSLLRGGRRAVGPPARGVAGQGCGALALLGGALVFLWALWTLGGAGLLAALAAPLLALTAGFPPLLWGALILILLVLLALTLFGGRLIPPRRRR